MMALCDAVMHFASDTDLACLIPSHFAVMLQSYGSCSHVFLCSPRSINRYQPRIEHFIAEKVASGQVRTRDEHQPLQILWLWLYLYYGIIPAFWSYWVFCGEAVIRQWKCSASSLQVYVRAVLNICVRNESEKFWEHSPLLTSNGC